MAARTRRLAPPPSPSHASKGGCLNDASVVRPAGQPVDRWSDQTWFCSRLIGRRRPNSNQNEGGIYGCEKILMLGGGLRRGLRGGWFLSKPFRPSAHGARCLSRQEGGRHRAHGDYTISKATRLTSEKRGHNFTLNAAFDEVKAEGYRRPGDSGRPGPGITSA